MKFDVITANPPYQAPREVDQKSSGDTIWHVFVHDAITRLLEDGGYMAFLHPSGWRKPTSEDLDLTDLEHKQNTSDGTYRYIWEELTKYPIYALYLYNTKDGMTYFDAGTRFEWYLLQKSDAKTITKIKGDDGNFYQEDLTEWDFLPNNNYEFVKSLLHPKPYNILQGGKKYVLKETKTEEYCYPVVNSTTSELKLFYTNEVIKTVPKFIIGESGQDTAFYDKDGSYGMTPNCFGVIVDEKEAEILEKFLKSSDFEKLKKACAWSNFRLDWRLFTKIRITDR